MNISHLVLISADVDPDAVEQVAADLEAARAAGEIEYISLQIGVRLAPHVRDGLLGGRLETGKAGEHVLLVRLADEAALKTYYATPAHAAIRRRFLSRVSPECARLYAVADGDTEGGPGIFDQIERIAGGLMRRIDTAMG